MHQKALTICVEYQLGAENLLLRTYHVIKTR